MRPVGGDVRLRLEVLEQIVIKEMLWQKKPFFQA
jgi:hypothetical protein